MYSVIQIYLTRILCFCLFLEYFLYLEYLTTSFSIDLNSEVEEKIVETLKLDSDSDMDCAGKGLLHCIYSGPEKFHGVAHG